MFCVHIVTQVLFLWIGVYQAKRKLKYSGSTYRGSCVDGHHDVCLSLSEYKFNLISWFGLHIIEVTAVTDELSKMEIRFLFFVWFIKLFDLFRFGFTIADAKEILR